MALVVTDTPPGHPDDAPPPVGVVAPTNFFGLVAAVGPLFLCHRQNPALAVHRLTDLHEGVGPTLLPPCALQAQAGLRAA